MVVWTTEGWKTNRFSVQFKYPEHLCQWNLISVRETNDCSEKAWLLIWNSWWQATKYALGFNLVVLSLASINRPRMETEKLSWFSAQFKSELIFNENQNKAGKYHWIYDSENQLIKSLGSNYKNPESVPFCLRIVNKNRVYIKKV